MGTQLEKMVRDRKIESLDAPGTPTHTSPSKYSESPTADEDDQNSPGHVKFAGIKKSKKSPKLARPKENAIDLN